MPTFFGPEHLIKHFPNCSIMPLELHKVQVTGYENTAVCSSLFSGSSNINGSRGCLEENTVLQWQKQK